MIADFKSDLEFSISASEKNKAFYTKIGFENVNFVGYETDYDRRLQNSDIDVIATKDGVNVYISEKIRKRHYGGDILIEVYSNYEQKSYGWLKNSIANILLCFYLDRKIEVDVETLKCYLRRFAKEHKNFITSITSTADRMLNENENFSPLEGFDGMFVVIADNGIYHTVSVAIKTEQLKNNGVIIQEYD